MGWTGMLTKQGKDMSAALYGKKITFTACRCGYSDEPLTETSTIIPIKDMEILEADYKNGRTCVSTRLTNTGIKEATNVNQIGLYAKLENENEQLFYIWQTDEIVVLGKEDVLKIKDYDLYLTVSSLGNATIEVNTSNYLRKEHNADSEAHKDIRNDIGNVKNNIIDINMEITSLKKELGENLDKVANVLTELCMATGEKMTLEELETILREKIGAELKDKPKLAEAITNKGVPTESTDSLSIMADNINKISYGASVFALDVGESIEVSAKALILFNRDSSHTASITVKSTPTNICNDGASIIFAGVIAGDTDTYFMSHTKFNSNGECVISIAGTKNEKFIVFDEPVTQITAVTNCYLIVIE